MTYLVSTTYLKLFAMYDEFQTINTASPELSRHLDLDADYFSGEILESIFSQLADVGLESWIVRFAKHYSIASHGVLGFAILCAPTLRDALLTICEFSSLRVTSIRSELLEKQGRVYLRFHEEKASELAHRWLLESVLYSSVSMIEQVLARPLGDQAKIEIALAKPSYFEQLENLYGVKCQFDYNSTQLSFPAKWCSAQAPLGDTIAHQSNLQKCRELMLSIQRRNDPVVHLRHSLAHFFSARLSDDNNTNRHTNPRSEMLPSMSTIAASLHCSERTLARQLESQRTSYKQELTLARQQLACQLLKTTYLKIADIADVLAYSDTANFVRAFKSWFDMPPSEWRRRPND